jgi:hypothetical protein
MSKSPNSETVYRLCLPNGTTFGVYTSTDLGTAGLTTYAKMNSTTSGNNDNTVDLSIPPPYNIKHSEIIGLWILKHKLETRFQSGYSGTGVFKWLCTQLDKKDDKHQRKFNADDIRLLLRFAREFCASRLTKGLTTYVSQKTGQPWFSNHTQVNLRVGGDQETPKDTRSTNSKSTRYNNADLKHLDLNYGAEITDAGLAHLSNLASLQYFNLKSCDQITDAGLAYLSRH